MQGNTGVVWQLVTLLNSLFAKEALRRNNYFFNSLNERMELPIKTIAKERKVAQLTHDLPTVVQALRQCPGVEVVSGNTVRILMKGDEVIVKLALPEGRRAAKKEVQALAKHMRCEIRENNDHFLIEFQSHAATVEFVERAKASNKDYLLTVQEKNPYRCIEESIANYRQEKKNPKQPAYHEPQQPYTYANSYANYDLAQYYSEHFPIFIRKAVPSDDEQEQPHKNQNPKKYVEKLKPEQQRPRFDSDEFPTFERLRVSSPPTKNE